MVEGTIRKLDLEERTAVIALPSGQEVHVRFTPDAHFEVAEPATMGTTGGRLEDLGLGYIVQIDAEDRHGDGVLHCTDLVCIS